MPHVRVCIAIATALAIWAPILSAAAGAITGTIRDRSGAPVVGADVVLMTPDRTAIASASSDADGKFRVTAPAPGSYLLVVRARAFREAPRAVVVGATDPDPLDIVLDVAALDEQVTVTATRDGVADLRVAGQPVNLVDEAEIGERVRTVVAQAVEGESGVHLQRTSPTMAGVFIRGLTGNKVNVFVDGVRYSNGAQRGGVNTFLDLVEPDSLESIEVLRGPSSAQYGSDALGGSIQFLTRVPSLASEAGPEWRGQIGVAAGTGHRAGMGSALASYMGTSLGISAGASGQHVGRIRTGRGLDSHAAATRFLGVPSDAVMDARLPDTGFHQYGGWIRANWVPRPHTQVVTSYMATRQDDGDRYDQLLGGDGNLIAELNDLTLDLFSARVQRFDLGWFDLASVTYSLNSQREERVNQGGNGSNTATISHEPERTTVHGIQGMVTRQVSPRHSLSFGGDVYFESLSSLATNVNPVTGAVTPRRPRVPDGATFTQGGVYGGTAFDLMPNRVRLTGSLRYGGGRYRAEAADSPIVNGQPLWPDDALAASATTFRIAATIQPSDAWTVGGSVSRGFRAPHMTDLGTLGLTGAGFEITSAEVEGRGATVGTTADASAASTGDAVEQVGPETSLQYEGFVHFRKRRVRTELTVFMNDVHDNIQKQAVILPQGAVGSALGGTPIVAQTANGAVFVAATTVPVLVRVNFDNARVKGIEHTFEARVGSQLSVNTAFTYLRTRDRDTGLPPNIEGGTPAPDAWVSARWTSGDGRLWFEPYLHAAWEQSHLSTLDLGDRRTGASRSRANIRAFFLNGATNRGWVNPGPDGAFGTADDVLAATGETLAQIQDRVLGVGVNAAPLFTSLPGYATIGVRAGYRVGPHRVTVDAENLNDRNYRGISWGVDATGIGVNVRYAVTF